MFKDSAKKLEIFVIVAIIAVIGIIYALTKQPVKAPTIQDTAKQTEVSSVKYQGVEGKTAFELLKSQHSVEANHYDFGDLVSSIDGITPDKNHFWAFYVNGKFSDVGASAYVTKSSDVIEWKLEEVKN